MNAAWGEKVRPVVTLQKFDSNKFSEPILKNSGIGVQNFIDSQDALSENFFQLANFEIRENLGWQEEGWGRLKAFAEIGTSKWQTAIWFDTKYKTYVLPLKADIRAKEKLELNMVIKSTVWV